MNITKLIFIIILSFFTKNRRANFKGIQIKRRAYLKNLKKCFYSNLLDKVVQFPYPLSKKANK